MPYIRIAGSVPTAPWWAASLCFLLAAPASAQILIAPDCGNPDAYGQITKTGYHLELPDCGHPVKHITTQYDAALGECVLAFAAHRDFDDDRCGAKDRQRTEIRLNDPKIVNGVACTHSWKFKLDQGFQPSPSFCHIHQIKAEGGDAAAPMWTLTPRAGSPEQMQVIYVGASGGGTRAAVDLAPFKGAWVQAAEHITFGAAGKYSLVLTRIADGQILLSYSTANVNNARSGAAEYSPKFGIYRSLNDKSYLRDEIVLFTDICRAVGESGCPVAGEQNGVVPPAGPGAARPRRHAALSGSAEGFTFARPGSGSDDFGFFSLSGRWLNPQAAGWVRAGE